MLGLIELYAPSFLTRYALQLMTVALPWMLQAQSNSIDSIASTFIFFYLGSLLAGSLALKFVREIRVRDGLAISLLLQGILSALCFVCADSMGLALIRFGQGFVLGWARPSNQIFINEYQSDFSRDALKKRAIFSQVGITVGMIFGSGLGAAIGFSSDDPFLMITLAILGCGVPSVVVAILLRWNPYKLHHRLSDDRRSLFRTLLTPELFTILIVYLLSLTVFKAWILLIPFELRAVPQVFGFDDISWFLTVLFLLHPMFFALAQFLVGKFSHQLPSTNHRRFLLMILATAGQALFPFLGLLTGNAWLVGISVIIGGAFLAAIIYPLMMAVLYDFIPEPQGVLMRQIYIVLAITADIGQLIGVFILAPQIGQRMLWVLPTLCLATLAFGVFHFITFRRSTNRA